MEIVYFTLAAIALYFIADWILDRIEDMRGARFTTYRSMIFFAIILVLAQIVFYAINRLWRM